MRRFLRAIAGTTIGLGGLIALAAPSLAAGILPPTNPPANLPTPPSFETTGPCQQVAGGYSCPQAPCFEGVVPSLQTAFSTLQENAKCTAAAVAAIDAARTKEGVGPMNLPSNWSSLTVPEQVFVATDLERVDRGVPALTGMVAAADADAQAGAAAGEDPVLNQSYGPVSSAASGSIWAGGELSPLLADYDWMYADGYSGGHGGNIDCTSPSASGCWGHRDIMLGAYTGTTCATCVMGTGYAANAADGYYLSYTGLVVKPRVPVTSFVFTWAQELPYLNGSTGFSSGTGTVSAPPTPGAPVPSASRGSAFRDSTSAGLGGAIGMVGIQRTSDGGGYWITDSSGALHSFGDATSATGSLPATVASTATPDGKGWWLASANGTVTNLGDAPALGGATGLTHPIVGMAASPDGHGYWLVASDGGIFSFGDAVFYGSTGAERLARPIVGMATTPDGGGYWLVASDGGIFSFGDAAFYGSTGAEALARPVVGMTASPDGHGYWLVASDGGIFSFGDAVFHGSTGAEALARPIVGMAASPDGHGYWLVGADGGVFTFGDAAFAGSAA